MGKKFLLFFWLLIFCRGIFAMDILSNAFSDSQTIPARFTCDGQNISPQLHWKNIPAHTKSLALICDDPDAPGGTWIHWVVYNIPPSITAFEEDIRRLPFGAQDGINSWSTKGYGGPCPPNGEHRYFFKLYALDKILDLNGKITSNILEKEMSKHILSQATLMGKYQRPNK
jgi:Raf kinase inhibitor-like YbhB/YbcL family protein